MCVVGLLAYQCGGFVRAELTGQDFGELVEERCGALRFFRREQFFKVVFQRVVVEGAGVANEYLSSIRRGS